MQKKLWYLIPILLLILCLLVPGILADRQGKNNGSDPTAPPVNAGDIAGDSVLPVLSDKESTGNASATSKAPGISGEDTAGTRETVDAIESADAQPVQKSITSNPVAASAKTTDSNETLTVNIAVVGKNGQFLFSPGSVELAQGATAVDALAATGLVYATSKRFPDLVESVAGFSNRGQAGWLYQVNGEVPLVAASKKQVSADDRVIWWYSNSINEPVPSWEQLAK